MYSLRKLNKDMIKALNTVGDISNNISKTYTTISELYGANNAGDFSEVFRKLGNLYKGTVDSFNKLAESTKNDFLKYFHYYSKELIELESLHKKLNDEKNKYLSMHKKFKKKQESLFIEGKTENWQLSKDCKHSAETMLKDRELAYSEMLLNDRKDLVKEHKTCGYYLNKSKEEYEWIKKKNSKRFYDHLVNVGNNCSDIFKEVSIYYMID